VFSSLDFLLLFFVLNELFMVFFCFLIVVRLKLLHVLLFSSLYFWCIVLVISSFRLVVKLVFHVSLTSLMSSSCHETNKLLFCVC
jgi:hypothetical protein